jgi:ABC-type transport system involved in cytochrome c biogenesis ATPase subunit
VTEAWRKPPTDKMGGSPVPGGGPGPYGRPMIEVRELSKRYGATVAVDRLSFEARPGAVTGFLGPNGAGKSTTMRMLLGLDEPDSGQALLGGRRYRELPWPLREVGALLEARAFHPGRSARDHLAALAAANGIPRSRVGEVLGLVGLEGVAGRRAGTLSLGMAQRLGIAAALLGDPGVLLWTSRSTAWTRRGSAGCGPCCGRWPPRAGSCCLQPPDRRDGPHGRAAGGGRPGTAAGPDDGDGAVGPLDLAARSPSWPTP